ncbi:unnamed protein product [Ilex paraguariensis]|uniref:Protein pelota homolog n=1 Tax=Ilex paraguariensis TaxID=185542 RepID=A0ABC8UAQ4_9AQUA
MKLLESKIVLNQPGDVKLLPEELDDLWLLYNLIAAGDVISADTSRKIHNASDSGSKKNPSRVNVELEIRVTAVDYNKNSPVIRVRGKTITCNEFVKPGVFHTIELEKNKEFHLTKKVWNEEAMNTLKEGCDRTAGADLVVVLMCEGLAHMFSVGRSVAMVCPPIEGSTGHKSGSNKFFENVFRAFTKHIDLDVIRCVVIGSLGSIKDEFRNYLLSEALKLKMKSITNSKSRIVLLDTKALYINSLKEVLNEATVMDLIKDTKAATEIKAFKEFTDMVSSNSDRACYGPKSVETANELTAIETLMITDDLYKSEEIETRQKYIELVKSVKKASGKVLVFSSTHVCYEKLAQLTGIAAILRFPLPDLEELEL